jgi:hypothetical protein
MPWWMAKRRQSPEWTAIRLTEKQLEPDFIERIVALLRQSSLSEETASGQIRRTE